MIFKIRTSKRTMVIFEEITASTNYAPYILSKLSISLSLKSEEQMIESDYKTDSLGLELNRQTITGEWDNLYKSLIEMFEGTHVSDDDYFQKHLKAHLDRGARMLYSTFKYNKDLLIALLNDDRGI